MGKHIHLRTLARAIPENGDGDVAHQLREDELSHLITRAHGDAWWSGDILVRFFRELAKRGEDGKRREWGIDTMLQEFQSTTDA